MNMVWHYDVLINANHSLDIFLYHQSGFRQRDYRDDVGIVPYYFTQSLESVFYA